MLCSSYCILVGDTGLWFISLWVTLSLIMWRGFPLPGLWSRKCFPVPDLHDHSKTALTPCPKESKRCCQWVELPEVRTSADVSSWIGPFGSSFLLQNARGSHISYPCDSNYSPNYDLVIWGIRCFLRPNWITGRMLCVLVAQSCLTLCDPMDCSSTRLLCPWTSPGMNTGVGCHFLLQGIFLTQRLNLGSPAL